LAPVSLLGFLDVGEDRDTFEVFTGFLRVHAGDEGFTAVRVVAAHAGVELAGLAGDTLGDDFGVFVNQNRHVISFAN
jgi:hypothetical protein